MWLLANSFSSSERAEIHSGFFVKLLPISVGNKAKVPATLKTKEAPHVLTTSPLKPSYRVCRIRESREPLNPWNMLRASP